MPPRIPNVSLSVIAERTREAYDGPLTIGENLMRFVVAGGNRVTVIPHYAENE